MVVCNCNLGSKSIYTLRELRFHSASFCFFPNWAISQNVFPHSLHSTEEEVIVRSQPDSQYASHRRSYQSAAGQIWEPGLWLEMTFFSFSASCVSPSTCLPNSLTLHVFHVCCLRSIETNPSGCCVFPNKSAHGTYTQTDMHSVIDCLL